MLLQVSNETDGVLNSTVQPHFPAQIYSSPIISFKFCLYCISPTHPKHHNPPMLRAQLWESWEILGNSTQAVPLQANVPNEETMWSTALYIRKAWQVRRGGALRNCPAQASKEVILICPSPWRTWFVYLILLSKLHSYQLSVLRFPSLPIWSTQQLPQRVSQGEGTGWNESPFRIHQGQVPHHQGATEQ